MVFLLIQTVLISLTGVVAPGPITAVTVGSGTRSPHAGAMVALGHVIVELPLMALIYFGLGDFLGNNAVRSTVFFFGGAFLLYMGIDMLRSVRNTAELTDSASGKPLTAGIVLSLGNVYFLVWWATVGASLISKAVAYGLTGVMLFALIHWSCDFIWLYFLSATAFKGGRMFGIIFQKVVFVVCGLFLMGFGLLFLGDSLSLFFV